MLGRDSLGSAAGAFLTGVAVTSGPWLLTTAVLVLMRISAVTAGIVGVTDTERIVTVVYAVVIVLSAPIDIVLTRYAADRVYERQQDRIATPLCAVLAACLVGFAAVGAVAMRICDVPLELALPGTLLATIVGGQWLLLSAAAGLSSPGIILRAFAAGAPVSVVSWIALSQPGVLGPPGYLYGFATGQLVTLVLLLWGTLRALPEHEDRTASILPAFRDYWLLAAAAFAFHAGLWADKLIVLLLTDEQYASQYAAQAALAWLSVVPACAYLFVKVETVFHRRFRAFYGALHAGASLPELELRATELRVEVGNALRGTAAVQLCVTLVCLMVAPAVVARLGLSDEGGALTISWLLAGAGLQVMALAAILLLYYFDFRVEAFAAALTQVTANAVLTLVVGAPSSVALGAGYAIACALTCAVAIPLLGLRLGSLLARTFQSQPHPSES
jgi:polysaccharide biosynthesis protein PelG